MAGSEGTRFPLRSSTSVLAESSSAIEEEGDLGRFETELGARGHMLSQELPMEGANDGGSIIRLPERAEIDANLNEQLIVEYYSR